MEDIFGIPWLSLNGRVCLGPYYSYTMIHLLFRNSPCTAAGEGNLFNDDVAYVVQESRKQETYEDYSGYWPV